MAAMLTVLVSYINLSMSVEVPTAGMLVMLANCQGPLSVLEQDLSLVCKPC